MYPSKQPKKSFPTLTNKKAEHKANENTNKTKDTLQESSEKKRAKNKTTPHTNYASIVTEFRINLFLVICAILQKPFFKQTLHKFFQSQDTTTVTDYLGAPLTKKYSYIKYTHRR